MKATTILIEEHHVIMTMLACLDKIIAEASQKNRLNAESATAVVDFLKNFADGCHHAKEEDRLFIEMQEHGIPVNGGPIGVMLSEHEQGRACVRGMTAAIASASECDTTALEDFSRNAQDFIALLSAHIQKENQVLFPMADNVLSSETADTLLADFRQIEADAGGKRHAEWLALVRRLCDQYDVAFVAEEHISTLQSEFMSN